MDYTGLLAHFPPERERSLKAIKRYSMFEVMYYRPDVWLHSQRVAWIVDSLWPAIKDVFPKFDRSKARHLALVHDDAEMETGDIQAGHKAVMSSWRLAQVAKNEEKAIVKLAKKYPFRIGDHSYRRLLLDSLNKRSLESQVVSYADKVDAFCESLHEVLAGNMLFIEPIMFYTGMFARFDRKFPRLKPLLGNRHSVFANTGSRVDSWNIKTSYYAAFGRSHTARTLRKPTNFPVYNRWRELTFRYLGSKEAIAVLAHQQER